MLGRILATLAQTSFLDYPITVAKSERPDFLVAAGPRQIGVEVTEATTEAYGHVHAIANRHYPGGVLVDESLFRFGSERLTGPEIDEHLRSRKLTGPGWVGDTVEQQWAARIADAVATKTRKLNEQTYSRQGQNWLSIYDQIPGGLLDLQRGLELLQPQLASLTSPHQFDVVAIDTGSVPDGAQLVLVSRAGGFPLPIRTPSAQRLLWMESREKTTSACHGSRTMDRRSRTVELSHELRLTETDRPSILKNETCPYCGTVLTPDVDTEDHVIARRLVPKGMMAGSWNLQVRACEPCNNRKAGLEDDLSAITMQPDGLGRHVLDHPQLSMDADRKGRGSTSQRTGKRVADSIERFAVNVEPIPGVKITVNLSGPPQPDPDRVRELAWFQLMGFFYWLTYSDATRRGGFWHGPFCQLLHSLKADWGNPVHLSFMRAVSSWEPRFVSSTVAQGFFKIAIRRHPSAACWSWALEWNHNLRVVGLFGDFEACKEMAAGLSRLDLQPVPTSDGAALAARRDVPLPEGDDILFDVSLPQPS